MSLEEEFHQQLLDNYRIAGEQLGYWARYYLRELKSKGGLATAKRLLLPTGSHSIAAGLQTLIDAGRLDLSVEAVALSPKFRSLFTSAEFEEAQRRIASLPESLLPRAVPPELNHPDELEEKEYLEGATRKVTVNFYERDSAARTACIKRHGLRCAVCDMSFEARYGPIGRGFIHVHHKKQVALQRSEYKLSPLKDLVPVCPNCHAMLHTQSPPLGVEQLREIVQHYAEP